MADEHRDAKERSLAQVPTPRRGWWPFVDLFLISFLILFFELACIRWFGSTVIFLTFFTNLVLIACFLGMSVGCLAAGRKRNYIQMMGPLALIAVALAIGVLWIYENFGQVVVDVGDQRSPQQVFFGTEARVKDPSRFVMPIEVVAGTFFVLIALTFVGPGQELGRAFDAILDRVAAYTTNILGSMAGIAAFGAASYARTPPIVWFAIVLVLGLWFVRRWWPFHALMAVGLLALLGWTSYREAGTGETTWSPYYKVRYFPQDQSIHVNNILHQYMGKIGQHTPLYTLPYFMNRDAGSKPFQDVMIIGAGSGNDVAAVLAQGARYVDAVEIDPAMYEIGKARHPNRPYDNPRVVPHFDDGRSFVQKTNRKYDLIVYALVDSLVLHSGYSSIRLESFLFTEQAFRDIKAKLKPGGVFLVYNYFRQGWVVGRLEKLAEEVFGAKPLVFSIPYQEQIAPSDRQAQRATILMVGNRGTPALEAIRHSLESGLSFWSHIQPRFNAATNGFSLVPPEVAGAAPMSWFRIAPADVVTTGIGPLPTDDWPFLYLREASVPNLNRRGMLIVAVLSLAILLAFAPVRSARPNGQMFFLGAGFMLLETKGVVHMALLFGSTWVVNSIVFFAILVMILLSNLYVVRFRPKALWPFDVALIAALLVNVLVPMTTFLALSGAARIIVSCTVVFLPVFFAGVIFAASFRDSRRPDIDLGSNIGGVILGGLCEFASLVVGFDHLLGFAIVFYLLAAAFRWQFRLAVASPETSVM
jgi:spermidine synthase